MEQPFDRLPAEQPEQQPEMQPEMQPETKPEMPQEQPPITPPAPPVAGQPVAPFMYMPGTSAPQYANQPTPPQYANQPAPAPAPQQPQQPAPQPYYTQSPYGQPPMTPPYYGQRPPYPPQQPYYAQPPYGQPPYGYPYYQQPTQQPQPHKLNWLAVTALTLSIIGLAGFVVLMPLWFIWMPCSIAGLVMAIVAKAKKVPGGKTTAALVCGIIGTVLSLIFTAIVFMVLHTMTELPYEFYESIPYYEDYMQDM